MGIYGSCARQFMESQHNNTYEFIIESVAYSEYENRKSLLESCTNDNDKIVLEAQIEVLQEVAIKDIISKVKEAFNALKRFINKIWGIILEKVSDIKKKIIELKNNRKKGKSIKDKDFEHNDKIKKFIDQATVVQYKIDDKVEYAGYFSKNNEIFFDTEDNIKNLLTDLLGFFGEKVSGLVKNNVDIKEDPIYKKLESIKESIINGIKIELVPVTQYAKKEIKSSDNINALTTLQDFYFDIIFDVESDVQSISYVKKFNDRTMGSLQNNIDQWEKSANESDNRNTASDSDTVKSIESRHAEFCRKNASVYITVMNIIKEMNNDWLGIINKLNSALSSMESQIEGINNIYEELGF